MDERELWIRPIEWLKLNFANCVIHQTVNFATEGRNIAFDVQRWRHKNIFRLTDDNGKVMLQSFISKLLKIYFGWRYARTAANLQKKSKKRQLWVRPIKWLKLNFASCVMHQTRSLGVLIPYFIHNMVFVNYTYDMVVSTQFHKFYGRSFVRVLYLILMKDIGRWLPWMLPGSTGRFPVSSTPAVVRCAAGVGGAVWVDEHRVIHHSHTASKLCSPDGYRLGTTPPQYCIKPTQQNRVDVSYTHLTLPTKA